MNPLTAVCYGTVLVLARFFDQAQALKGAPHLSYRNCQRHKKKGLKVEAMAESHRVYRKLRNFRAGIEAGISYLNEYGFECGQSQRVPTQNTFVKKFY